MQFLAIDTTTLDIKLALFNTKTKEQFQLIEHVGRKQSEKLHVKIKEILDSANLKVEQLDTIIVNLGPGSYTSLRLGIATAKGFALPFKHINVIGINSFELIENLYNVEDDAGIILENNASQVYLQTNDSQVIIAPDELKDYLTKEQKVYGTGFDQYAEHLTNYNLQENTGSTTALDIINYCIKNNITQTNLDPLYIKPLTYKKYEYKL